MDAKVQRQRCDRRQSHQQALTRWSPQDMNSAFNRVAESAWDVSPENTIIILVLCDGDFPQVQRGLVETAVHNWWALSDMHQWSQSFGFYIFSWHGTLSLSNPTPTLSLLIAQLVESPSFNKSDLSLKTTISCDNQHKLSDTTLRVKLS